MSRPWRIQFPGAIYHVTARGNNRQDIFADDDDRRLFLDLLARAADRFRLDLFAFCLMTNHYHLFLRTREANLAAAMKWLNAAYAGRFNHRQRRSGHLFQGRYRSVLVTAEAHWLHLSFYLHLNPVRAGLAKDPGDYPWSSFRDYIRAVPRFGWLHPRELLAEYGASEAAQRRRYRRECRQLAGAEPNFWERMQSEVILGAEAAIKDLVKKHRPAGQASAVPAYLAAAKSPVNFELELARVARVFGVEAEALLRPARNFPARLAAYQHLVEHCGAQVVTVAEQMGLSGSGVSRGLGQFRRRLAQDRELRQKIQALKS